MIPRSLRRMGVIALAETGRTTGSFNRRTGIVLVALAVATGLVAPLLLSDGLDFDRGLYRVAVTDDAALGPAIDASRLFRRVATPDAFAAVDQGIADLAVTAEYVYARDDAKGNAAIAALRQAAKDYSFTRLLEEPDQAAAFPVRVELRYEAQARPAPGSAGGIPTEIPRITPTPDGGTTTGDVSGGGGRDGDDASAGEVGGSTTQGFAFLPPERSVNTPETLAPPFPFRSLLLAYAFLIPMNFVVQMYAGSAISERLQRKGEALLASPARPWEIIVGKAFPYFALMMLVCAGIVLWIGAGWLSLLAVAPLAYTFLALEFVAAMYARSFRELTFLTVFTSVLLTIYAFLPAVFTDVHPIALVSPITLVVLDLRNEAVTLAQVIYSLAPLTLFSTVLFLLGAALYREEDLFHQKPVLAKAVDSVARQVKGLASGVKLSLLLIPMVFIVELMLITFLFAWPVSVGAIGVLAVVALVEETFKAAPTYAGVRRGLVPGKRALLFGLLTGFGFWLAEKAFLLASIAGLSEVNAAAAVLGSTPSDLPWQQTLALLLLPLSLHVITAGITGWGAAKDRATFGLSFVFAVFLHVLYNLGVLAFSGGWTP